jgi:hypothetical protein
LGPAEVRENFYRLDYDVEPAVVATDGMVTDGPYPESKELIGGVFVVDVPTREAALKWAAKVAVARAGMSTAMSPGHGDARTVLAGRAPAVRSDGRGVQRRTGYHGGLPAAGHHRDSERDEPDEPQQHRVVL